MDLQAVGPQITSYQTDGNAISLAPVSVTETEQGLRGSVGWFGAGCPIPGADATSHGVTTLRAAITANDGGFITFRYRFRTNGMMGYQGWTTNSDIGSNHFRAKVVYGFDGLGSTYSYESGSVREAFWRQENDPGPECSQFYDTNWMETSIYVHPAGNVELWLSVGSWGGYAAQVEFENLTALCTATIGTPAVPAAGYTLPPAFVTERGTEHVTPRHRKTRRAVSVNSVASPCKGCCVSALTPLDPADADSVQMEGGYDAWFWLSRCTSEIQTATPCFKNQVEGAGGVFRLSNTLRTAWYQRHFREVWDKVQALDKDQSSECAALKQQVKAEKSKHLLGFQPAGAVNPRHVNGEAIDVSKHHNLTDTQLLDLAATCSLYRRVPKDLYHFESQQP
jgi:hypothetical protein